MPEPLPHIEPAQTQDDDMGLVLTRLAYTTGQAARVLNVDRSTIRVWIDQGKIATSRTLGGHHRIAAEEIERIHKEMHANGGTNGR